LASYTKKEVVSLAKEIKLPIEYRESQDVCFLKDKDYKTFLLERYKDGINEGDILDKEGKVLGRHKGLAFYTIGQRKGLGIALGYPLYVVGKDIEKNTITVGKAEDCFVDFVKAKDCSFISFPKSQLKARVRYKAEDTDAELQRMDDGSVVVRFKKRVFAPSPGQSIVFYEEDALIGGGIIE
jgi:tRNA-specific 2-thiouridylase